MPERRAARASLGEENGAAPNLTSVTSAPPDPCVVGRSGSSEETVLEAFPLRSDRADPVLFLADPRLICLSGLVGIVRGLVPAGRKALRRSPSRFVRFISERTVHAGPGSSRAGKPSCGRPILPDDMDSVLRAPSDIAQLEGRFEPDSGDESSADPLGNGPAQKFAASRSVARSGLSYALPPSVIEEDGLAPSSSRIGITLVRAETRPGLLRPPSRRNGISGSPTSRHPGGKGWPARLGSNRFRPRGRLPQFPA